MVMSKHKGNSFENKIYKDLREILPDIKKTLGSGSSEDDADLISNDYLFECKHHKELSWSQIYTFFSNLLLQAAKRDKIAILIWKENNQPIMVTSLHSEGELTLPTTYHYEIFKKILRMKHDK